MADDDMQLEDQEQPQPPPPPQAGDAGENYRAQISATAASRLKLPPFDADDPVPWFGYAELQFRLRQITVPIDQFTVVASSFLPGSSIFREAAPIILSEPDDSSYTRLKGFLLRGHTVSEFQRLERLLAAEPLGARRPTDMLADMQSLCPAGEDETAFFRHIFLRRLPAEIRSFVIEEKGPLRAIAERANLLQASLTSRPSLAAISTEEETVAAINGQRSRGKPQQQQQRQPQQQKPTANNPTPAQLAQQSAGLCFAHWRWGSNARSCKAPCSWQGN